MGHSEKTGLAVREFLIGSAIRRVTGNRIHEAAVSFAFASSFITSSFQRQIRPTCQLTCVMSNYIVWRPWENVSKTTLRFMCAVKSDRPIDRRTFSVGMSVLDEAIRRILKRYKRSSHSNGSVFRRPRRVCIGCSTRNHR